MSVSIAIIDRNEIYRESLKTLLEQVNGFNVAFISGDIKGMEGFRNIPVRALLLDYSLGNEKCTEIARLPEHCEITWKS
jgi:hypothetical protein